VLKQTPELTGTLVIAKNVTTRYLGAIKEAMENFFVPLFCITFKLHIL